MKITKSEKKFPVIHPDEPSRRSQWEKLVDMMIRPPKQQYRSSQLGPKQFKMNGQDCLRTEQEVDHEGMKLIVSLFGPIVSNYKVILYLHGNSSSRLEALHLLLYLPKGYTLACFDFFGCGNNPEGDTISLGVRESQQAQTVANYLRSKSYEVILWGRSMGAASALKYGKSKVIVADSSFKSMKKLCDEFAKRNKPEWIPECLITCLFPCLFYKLKSDIDEKGHFDLEELNIKEAVGKISKKTTIIFVVAEDDKLINQEHSQELYKRFKGKNKYLEVVKGGHNTKRPEEAIKKVMGLIEQHTSENSISKADIEVGEIKLLCNMQEA